MQIKRAAVAVFAALALGTAGFASASVLAVDGGTIQYGEGVVTSDDGVTANWLLETDDNTVRGVRVTGIDASMVGNELFVQVGSFKAHKTITAADVASGAAFAFPAPYQAPQSIEAIKVWIEG